MATESIYSSLVVKTTMAEEVTTRKVSLETVELLKSLQEHIGRRGLKMTQQELLQEIVTYAAEQENDLYNFAKTVEEEPLKAFLKPSAKGPKTNCVREIDGVL